MTLRVSLSGTTDHPLLRVQGGDPKGNDAVNALVSAWPGWHRLPHKKGEHSTYMGPLSVMSAMQLRDTAQTVTWEGNAREHAEELLHRFQRARSLLEGESDLSVVKNPKLTLALNHRLTITDRVPMPYQLSGVGALMLLGGRVLLADEMGLGKTSQALWLAALLTGHGCDRVLVCCPASVKFNWAKEVLATIGEQWTTAVIDGTPKQRINQFAELQALYLKNNKLVVILNYDLLLRLTEDQQATLERFVDGQLFIGDEFHKLKSHKSQRHGIVKRLFCPREGGARWRIGITGTPVYNTIEDLYAQVELLRPGTFYSYSWFMDRYTVQSAIMVGKKRKIRKNIVRGTKNSGELNVLMNTMQIQRKKAEVSDLPLKVFTYPELELDAYTARVYNAMRDYAMLQLEEVNDDVSLMSPTLSTVARTALECAARCEQLAQGCVGGIPEELLPRLSGVLASHAERVEGKPGWLVFPRSAKLAWVQEQLEALRRQGSQAVVFSRFNAPLMWLGAQSESIKGGLPITGNMPNNIRQAAFDEFQQGCIRELYIQIKIAEGFNLHAAQDEILIGREWAPAVNAQAVDRLHRIGQKGTVNVQIPIVRGTIDERLHKALAAKEKQASSVMAFLTFRDIKEALS